MELHSYNDIKLYYCVGRGEETGLCCDGFPLTTQATLARKMSLAGIDKAQIGSVERDLAMHTLEEGIERFWVQQKASVVRGYRCEVEKSQL